jgi:type VI secretion system protein
MAERSLLERLAASRPGRPVARGDGTASVESVMRNLRRLFNSRQGCALTRPDLGLPDFGSLVHGFPNALHDIIKAIKYQIEQFEPRLKNVQVRHQVDADDPRLIRFHIRAEFAGADDSTPVLFDGVLGNDGHIDVRA